MLMIDTQWQLHHGAGPFRKLVFGMLVQPMDYSDGGGAGSWLGRKHLTRK